MRTTVDFAVISSGESFQKEFPPSAAEIKRSHAVYQERIVVAARRPNERSPIVTQPFNRSDAAFFHSRLKHTKATGSRRRPLDRGSLRKHQQKKPQVCGKRD